MTISPAPARTSLSLECPSVSAGESWLSLRACERVFWRIRMTHNIFAAVQATKGSGKTAEFTPHGEPEPISSMPGTREKVAEMARRAEDGLELWSDGDRTDLTG